MLPALHLYMFASNCRFNRFHYCFETLFAFQWLSNLSSDTLGAKVECFDRKSYYVSQHRIHPKPCRPKTLNSHSKYLCTMQQKVTLKRARWPQYRSCFLSCAPLLLYTESLRLLSKKWQSLCASSESFTLLECFGRLRQWRHWYNRIPFIALLSMTCVACRQRKAWVHFGIVLFCTLVSRNWFMPNIDASRDYSEKVQNICVGAPHLLPWTSSYVLRLRVCGRTKITSMRAH